MSRFGKSHEDQLFYKNCKLEKANEELVNRINNELIPTVKQLTANNETLKRVLILSLFELGGSIELSHEDFNNASGRIQSKVDSDNKTTTFYLESEAAVTESEK